MTETTGQADETENAPVLEGVTVVEVAQWWFAPSAAAILGEWGAEVIKVEHPEYGDPIRGLTTGGTMPGSYDVNFMVEQANRGKRSIGVNLREPEGRAVLDRLIERADVFITSYLPPLRTRLGIDVDDVRAVNPQIIYARAHGAGDRGPERERAGFDATSFWARGGVAHHLTPTDAAMPLMPRPSFGDGTSGLGLAGAISAALFRRERQGRPSVVDVSLLSTALWVMSPDVVASSLMDGGMPRMSSERRMVNPLSGTYRTADDRWLWFGMLQADRHWPEVCEHIGRPDLLDDPRFATAEARAENIDECVAELDAVFAKHTLEEWRRKLATLEGAWSVVQSGTDLLDDPQVVANGYAPEVDYGDRTLRLVNAPAQFDGHATGLSPAPGVGEHTDDILQELGHDWDQIIALKLNGTVT